MHIWLSPLSVACKMKSICNANRQKEELVVPLSAVPQQVPMANVDLCSSYKDHEDTLEPHQSLTLDEISVYFCLLEIDRYITF